MYSFAQTIVQLIDLDENQCATDHTEAHDHVDF